MCCLGGCRGLEKEREELGPCVDWHLDACDSSNDAGSGVTDQSAEEGQEVLIGWFGIMGTRHEL
jgi:hypothetical protein